MWSTTTHSTKENKTKELLSASAYKGLKEQEVTPDWLKEIIKRNLQSGFRTFRKPSNEALSLAGGNTKKGASILCSSCQQ